MTKKSWKKEISQSSSLVCLANDTYILEVFLGDQSRGNNVMSKECIMINVSIMSARGSDTNLLLGKCCPYFQCEHITICFCRVGISDKRGKRELGISFLFPENAVHPCWMCSSIRRIRPALWVFPTLPVYLSPSAWELDSLPTLRLHSWGILLLPATLWAK